MHESPQALPVVQTLQQEMAESGASRVDGATPEAVGTGVNSNERFAGGSKEWSAAEEYTVINIEVTSVIKARSTDFKFSSDSRLRNLNSHQSEKA